jgi:stage II sporulation protein D
MTPPPARTPPPLNSAFERARPRPLEGGVSCASARTKVRAQRAPLHALASLVSPFSLFPLAALCCALHLTTTACDAPTRRPPSDRNDTRTSPPLDAAPATTATAPKSPASSTPSPAAPPRRTRTLPNLPLVLEIELAAHRRAELREDYPGELREERRADGTTRVIERVDLEDYLAGVLRGELVVWDAPSALLEAQAVAARSYALAALELRAQQGRSGPLPAGTASQAYRGAPCGKLSSAERKVEQRVLAAVAATRGLVLVADGCVLDARFHAACGGQTAAFADVFATQEDLGAMPSVACRGCAAEPPWQVALPRAALARVWGDLGLSPKEWALAPSARDAHGRWLAVELRSKGKQRRMPFEEWRARIGATLLPSSAIQNAVPVAGSVIDASLKLSGRGRGHGVGLCQVGARHEASRGASAAQILARYFPGARIQRLNGVAAR